MWSQDEHRLFVEALGMYHRNWKEVAAHVGTKTVVQIRSHAQKFFIQMQKRGEKDQIPPDSMEARAMAAAAQPKRGGSGSSGASATPRVRKQGKTHKGAPGDAHVSTEGPCMRTVSREGGANGQSGDKQERASGAVLPGHSPSAHANTACARDPPASNADFAKMSSVEALEDTVGALNGTQEQPGTSTGMPNPSYANAAAPAPEGAATGSPDAYDSHIFRFAASALEPGQPVGDLYACLAGMPSPARRRAGALLYDVLVHMEAMLRSGGGPLERVAPSQPPVAAVGVARSSAPSHPVPRVIADRGAPLTMPCYPHPRHPAVLAMAMVPEHASAARGAAKRARDARDTEAGAARPRGSKEDDSAAASCVPAAGDETSTQQEAGEQALARSAALRTTDATRHGGQASAPGSTDCAQMNQNPSFQSVTGAQVAGLGRESAQRMAGAPTCVPSVGPAPVVWGVHGAPMPGAHSSLQSHPSYATTPASGSVASQDAALCPRHLPAAQLLRVSSQALGAGADRRACAGQDTGTPPVQGSQALGAAYLHQFGAVHVFAQQPHAQAGQPYLEGTHYGLASSSARGAQPYPVPAGSLLQTWPGARAASPLWRFPYRVPPDTYLEPLEERSGMPEGRLGTLAPVQPTVPRGAAHGAATSSSPAGALSGMPERQSPLQHAHAWQHMVQQPQPQQE